MRQSSADKVRARAEALAQPMPEHELANVDLDTHTVISSTASRGLVVTVVLAVLISVAFFACQRQDSDDGAGGADMLATTSGPGAPGGAADTGMGGAVPASDTGQATAGDGSQSDEQAESQEVVVSVQGMVHHPGLLRVQATTRVGEAIEAAGGGLPKAVVLGINLAEPVSDGMQIVVDDRGSRVVYAGGAQSAPGGTAGAGAGGANQGGGAGGGSARGADGANGADAKVNLNTADATQLETISGIGPATAEAIIDWRESNGPFTSVEQLLDVRGIGPAKFEAMRDAVTI
ncbi:comEA protein [Corynebacterium jeikeium ATCC 43734]|nr:comEA protein [Corynebacterium jeikeium ATCC 43734]